MNKIVRFCNLSLAQMNNDILSGTRFDCLNVRLSVHFLIKRSFIHAVIFVIWYRITTTLCYTTQTNDRQQKYMYIIVVC